MRVLIAPDKFKDALTASQACAAIVDGLREAGVGWEIDVCPLADGGEGFARILTEAAKGEWRTVFATGPRGADVSAGFGLVDAAGISSEARRRLVGAPDAGLLAVVEMASASGLALLAEGERDVWRADTRGTGELLAAAVRAGARGILLGVGGSATNDLGLGALVALGAMPLREGNEPVSGCAPADWPGIRSVDRGRLMKTPPIWIACDVVNPLLGPDGAAAVYGRQKGLSAGTLPRLEAECARMAGLLAESGEAARLAGTPGSGAAGGIAFGLMAALGARLAPGYDLVSDWLALGRRIAEADLVITGEGRFDESSLRGKGAGSLARTALALGKPVRVFAGRVDATERRAGLELHELSPRGERLADSLARTEERLRESAREVFAAE